jgi:cysteinyl-tRNA synthetase
MYLCGPTVYKPSHIGHMVGPVIFDAIKRYLVYNGYDVTFVINITDVDDKLIAEANARNTSMAAVAEEMTADYMRNLDAMGVRANVDHFPKVTDYMPQIIGFITDLIDQGYAYPADGDVYFDVTKDDDYGKLSHRSLNQMQGEGGSTVGQKHSPYDFALWKSAKPGEPSWDSPWGKGRPVWHIECSVMSGELLGKTFDIHGGGLDLVFPHHENEIAQSESRHGCSMAKYWLHNGLMQASNEVGKVGGRNTREQETVTAEIGDLHSQEAGKISKSKGSSAFSELLKQFDPETIRFFLLSSHYRRPIDYSAERLQEVGKGMETFYRFFKRFEKIQRFERHPENFYTLRPCKQRGDIDVYWGHDIEKQIIDLRLRFLNAMDDDFNTGAAISILFDLVRALNKLIDDWDLESGVGDEGMLWMGTNVLKELCSTLGLFLEPSQEKADSGNSELVGKLMALLIELRASARQSKDFATADKIRKDLADMGITLEDRPSGTEWSS